VVLDLLLVATELVLDFMNALIHRRLGGGTNLAGDKVMLMLSRNQDLDVPGLLPLIDRNLDGHQPAKILAQLLSLIVQVTLLFGTQATVACRDLDLHSSAPCLVILPTPPYASDGDSKKLTPCGVFGQDYTDATTQRSSGALLPLLLIAAATADARWALFLEHAVA
jgi:hypothetical protein